MSVDTLAPVIAGHDADCLCTDCMMADLDAHIVETRGAEALDRINLDQAGQRKDTSERTRYAQPGQRCGSGWVRVVSPRQVAFIKRLMAERDTRNLTRLPGSENIERMSLAGARDLIDRLLACPELPKATGERMATAKQVEWLGKMAGKDVPADIEAIRVKGAAATFAEASRALDVLFKAGYVKAPEVSVKEITGIYELDGCYFRMQKARNGRHFYAMQLDREAGDAWNYAAGMARRVPAEGRKLSLAECEALSLQLGGCCMCGKTLTATVNGIGPGARFIGPVCQGKMGF